MILLVEFISFILGASLFVASQGTAFKRRFSSSAVLQTIVALVAIIAFVLLVRDVVQIYKSWRGTEATAVAAPPARSAEDLLRRGMEEASAGAHGAAIRDFDEALALEPDYAEAMVARGRSFMALGRYNRALADFDLALRTRPTFAEATRYRQEAIDAKTNRLLEPLWNEIAQTQ